MVSGCGAGAVIIGKAEASGLGLVDIFDHLFIAQRVALSSWGPFILNTTTTSYD
jgi:hypothetical protein